MWCSSRGPARAGAQVDWAGVLTGLVGRRRGWRGGGRALGRRDGDFHLTDTGAAMETSRQAAIAKTDGPAEPAAASNHFRTIGTAGTGRGGKQQLALLKLVAAKIECHALETKQPTEDIEPPPHHRLNASATGQDASAGIEELPPPLQAGRSAVTINAPTMRQMTPTLLRLRNLNSGAGRPAPDEAGGQTQQTHHPRTGNLRPHGNSKCWCLRRTSFGLAAPEPNRRARS